MTSSGLKWGTDGLRVHLSAPGAVATADPAGQAVLTWDVELGSQSDQEIGWCLTVHDETAVVLAAPGATAGWAWIPRSRAGELGVYRANGQLAGVALADADGGAPDQRRAAARCDKLSFPRDSYAHCRKALLRVLVPDRPELSALWR